MSVQVTTALVADREPDVSFEEVFPSVTVEDA